MIKHIRRWNIWRKHCMNSPFYKFLVLIGFRKSPTMLFTSLPEEWLAYEEESKKRKIEYLQGRADAIDEINEIMNMDAPISNVLYEIDKWLKEQMQKRGRE